MARPSRRFYQRGRASYSHTPLIVPVVNGYTIEIVSPVNGATVRDAKPTILFVPTSILGDPVDVQVEWRTTVPVLPYPYVTWSPAPTYSQELTGLSSGDTHSVQPPTDLTQRSWWYRLRAGNLSANVWGAWTQANQYLDVQAIIGSIASYLDMNIGVMSRVTMDAVVYMDLNVGTAVVPSLDVAASYSDMNVGIFSVWKLAAQYSDLNISPVLEALASTTYLDLNVTTEQPDPVIWWIRPEQGREGYVFNIYGHGFGDFQNQYDGQVRLGEYICQISRWEKVTEQSGVAHIIKHGMALDPDEITTEYGWIVAIVPTGALSAMVKVVLRAGE